MKTITVSILLLLSFKSFTQELVIRDTITRSGKTKSDLYTLTKIWVAKTFVDANNVIKMDDKDAGVLILKGNSNVHVKGSFGTGVGYDGACWYTITFYLKDEQCVYTIEGIGSREYPLQTEMKSKRDKPYREACLKVVDHLKEEINKAVQ